VTIYSEMLKLALDGEPEDRRRPIGALVSEALIHRARLSDPRRGAPGSHPGPAADRVADSLAYDVALVRLCERLQLEQDLTADGDVRTARVRAEARLVERLPTLAAALDASEQAEVVDWP
jgi:hypothetical protein